MIRYMSTRGSGIKVSAADGVIKGIAEDKGLYVPDSVPTIPFSFEELRDMKYEDVAKAVIGAFFTDYTDGEIADCVEEAYGEGFESEYVAPLVKLGNVSILELYHGKTAAFKDMALSILPYLLTTAVKKQNEDKKIAILTATSGDTGKAALEGFSDVDGTEIIVFYPKSGVSVVQERQMLTQKGNNTHVYGIDGNFDDAQTGVKRIFNDKNFAVKLAERGYRLSSANSINIGRLIPQIAYYVWAYGQMIKQGSINPGDRINIVVPTGNFGNILAAYYAGSMGIPVNKFICASNKNKVLTDFIKTGIYDANREFFVTNSPSMDILISSNLERLLFILSDNSGEEINKLMVELENNKKYVVSDKIKAGLNDFYSGFCDEKDTLSEIYKVWKEERYLMDTHTAVAHKVYRDYVAESKDDTPAVIISTASAYKFADSCISALGIKENLNGFECIERLNDLTGVVIPAGLKDLDKKEVKHDSVVPKEHLDKAVLEALK